MEKEKYHLIKIVQQSCENETWFQGHKLILNLQRNTNDMYECRGRIKGDCPVFLKTHYYPRRPKHEARSSYANNPWGVGLTMGNVTESKCTRIFT